MGIHGVYKPTNITGVPRGASPCPQPFNLWGPCGPPLVQTLVVALSDFAGTPAERCEKTSKKIQKLTGNLMRYGMLMGFQWDFHEKLLTGAKRMEFSGMIHNNYQYLSIIIPATPIPIHSNDNVRPFHHGPTVTAIHWTLPIPGSRTYRKSWPSRSIK